MSKEDRIRELYMNLTATMIQFQKCLAAYIHEAEYPIVHLMRNLDGKISCAEMLLDGGSRVFFRADEWQVMMPVEGNPVNFDLLEKWESKEIDKEIEYHNNQLTQLLARKREILSKESTHILSKANLSTRAKAVLGTLCHENNLSYFDLTADYLVNNFEKTDLLKVQGCGKTIYQEILDYIDLLGLKWQT